MRMVVLPMLLALTAGLAAAQTSIYRCPDNTYTNSDAEAQARSCKKLEARKSPVVEQKPRPQIEIDPSILAPAASPPPPPAKRELGIVDRWRYNSCREEATKAPTEAGVRVALRLCEERFGQ